MAFNVVVIVNIDFDLSLSEFAAFSTDDVSSLFKFDPADSKDPSVDHEPKSVGHVAFKGDCVKSNASVSKALVEDRPHFRYVSGKFSVNFQKFGFIFTVVFY